MNSFKRKIIKTITRTFGVGLAESIAQFRSQMVAAGVNPPDEIIPDGQLHRFSSNGKPSDTSGWYVLYTDPIPAGAFGCWRSQISEKWSAKFAYELSAQEQRLINQRMEQVKVQHEAELKKRHTDSARRAQQKWAYAQPVAKHPYLERKGIQANGLRIYGDALLVPLFNADGALSSLQAIDADGGKRFMPGGQVAGCFHILGKPSTDIVICEGFATGATIFELTGLSVVMAFSAGNLPAVAKIVRQKYPHSRIIIAADNDLQRDGNPGVSKAKEAAASVAGRLAVPQSNAGEVGGSLDFNDLYLVGGAQAVVDCIGESASVSHDGDIWPRPRPVVSSRPSVEELHPDLIPNEIRDWVGDISFRMGCKLDFPAVAALVALSSLIGARAVISPKAVDTWKVVPVLWGQIISPPGSKKSPPLNEVMRPLHRMDSENRRTWQIEHGQWVADAKLQKLSAESNERQAKNLAISDPEKARSLLLPPSSSIDEPKLRRRVITDATVEKLGEVLVDHPHGILAFRDELHGLLTQMDKAGQEGARSFYLQGFDGDQPYTFDRIGRGTLHIPQVCIALLGGIQPGLLDDYVQKCLHGGVGNDGLLQRFGLSVWPDHEDEYQYVDQAPDPVAEARAHEVFERLDKLKAEPSGKPVVWRYSPSAQHIFRDWITELEAELLTLKSTPALASHFSKYRKLIPALSLVFALIDTPNSNQVVHERELMRAIAWGQYLRSHARRMYAVQSGPEAQRAGALLEKLRQFWVPDSKGTPNSFTPREVALKGWSGLGTSAEVRKAALTLVDHGWLRRIVVESADAKGRGRPSERYQIHPDIQTM